MTVHDIAGLYAALAGAKPGDVIELADGEYVADDRPECASDGTEAQPITLRGSRKAVIRSQRGPDSGSYGLHVTGNWWRLEGFRVTGCKKGIVCDGARHVVIRGVEVDHIGQEGIHFRSGSADGAVVDCDVHDTGLKSPSFGEGVYIGSAVSNWKHSDGSTQPYGENGGAGPDRSDRCVIQGCRIANTTAEGIDVKEGTVGGIIRGNRFDNCGWSGENSADSWVDVKGSGWLIEDNTGAKTLADAFQTHVIGGSTADSGTNNTFRRNRVEGGVPGYVVGVYPESAKRDPHGNTVHADNVGLSVKATSNITLTASTEPPPEPVPTPAPTPVPTPTPTPPPAPVPTPAPAPSADRALLISIRDQIDKALS